MITSEHIQTIIALGGGGAFLVSVTANIMQALWIKKQNGLKAEIKDMRGVFETRFDFIEKNMRSERDCEKHGIELIKDMKILLSEHQKECRQRRFSDSDEQDHRSVM